MKTTKKTLGLSVFMRDFPAIIAFHIAKGPFRGPFGRQTRLEQPFDAMRAIGATRTSRKADGSARKISERTRVAILIRG
jgi:hypothetical protein